MHFNTRCKCNPAKSEQKYLPDMTHMLVPVGKEAEVGERGDIEGSYPSFCYSAADPFSALVRELAATSTGGKAPKEKEELHLLVGNVWAFANTCTHTYTHLDTYKYSTIFLSWLFCILIALAHHFPHKHLCGCTHSTRPHSQLCSRGQASTRSVTNIRAALLQERLHSRHSAQVLLMQRCIHTRTHMLQRHTQTQTHTLHTQTHRSCTDTHMLDGHTCYTDKHTHCIVGPKVPS